MKYEPGHPDAHSSGIVLYPDIDIEAEAAAMLKAQYEYNLADKNCI